MGAYLVGTPAVQDGLDQGVGAEPFQQVNFRLAGLSPLQIYHCAVAAVAIEEQRQAHPSFTPCGLTHHQGMIGLAHLAPLELNFQEAVRLCGPGQEQHAAGIFIQTVHVPKASEMLTQQASQIGLVADPSPPLKRGCRPAC